MEVEIHLCRDSGPRGRGTLTSTAATNHQHRTIETTAEHRIIDALELIAAFTGAITDQEFADAAVDLTEYSARTFSGGPEKFQVATFRLGLDPYASQYLSRARWAVRPHVPPRYRYGVLWIKRDRVQLTCEDLRLRFTLCDCCKANVLSVLHQLWPAATAAAKTPEPQHHKANSHR
jgi:hypothetical protein